MDVNRANVTTLLKAFVCINAAYADIDSTEGRGFVRFFHVLELMQKRSFSVALSSKLVIPALIIFGKEISYQKTSDARIIAGKEMESLQEEFKVLLAEANNKAKEDVHWIDHFFVSTFIAGHVDGVKLAHDLFTIIYAAYAELDKASKEGFIEGYRAFEYCMRDYKLDEEQSLFITTMMSQKFGSCSDEFKINNQGIDNFAKRLADAGINLAPLTPPVFPPAIEEHILKYRSQITKPIMKLLLKKYGTIKDSKSNFVEFSLTHKLFQSIRCYYLIADGQELIYFVQIPHTNTIVNMDNFPCMIYPLQELPETLDEVLAKSITKTA